MKNGASPALQASILSPLFSPASEQYLPLTSSLIIRFGRPSPGASVKCRTYSSLAANDGTPRLVTWVAPATTWPATCDQDYGRAYSVSDIWQAWPGHFPVRSDRKHKTYRLHLTRTTWRSLVRFAWTVAHCLNIPGPVSFEFIAFLSSYISSFWLPCSNFYSLYFLEAYQLVLYRTKKFPLFSIYTFPTFYPILAP